MSNHPFQMNDKTVLVVGASSGIGKATAILLAKMGAQLIIVGRDQERLQDTLNQLQGIGHTSHICDMNDEQARESLVKSLPTLNGFFYSAGISRMSPLRFMSDHFLDETFNINFFSLYKLTRILLNSKLIKDAGSILYMASTGLYIGIPGQSAYSPSKAAVASLVKVLASEVAPKRIRVNCLAPGMVKTPFLEKSSVNAEQYKLDEATYPLGYGEADDVANAALYFLSDASKWITGNSFVMDGGLTLR